MASPAWERRNSRARALGYANYYDYRVHGYGASPPDEPRLSGEKLAQLRGHRSFADLESLVDSGRIELVKFLPQGKDRKTGQWRRLVVRVTLDDGVEKEFTLSGKQLSDKERLMNLRQTLVDAGAIGDYSYLDRLTGR